MSTIGIDTSAVAGNKPMDYAGIKAAGASFVIHKRSQYLRADACYARETEQARAAGLVVGSYFFPSVAIQAVPAKQQIAAFKNAPGDVIRGTDIPPALDIEGGGGGWAHYGRPKSEIVEILRQCVLELQDAYGCSPLIYTSYNQWYDLGLPAAPWAGKCPLWIKTAYRLKSGNPPDQVAPKAPHVDADALHDPRNHERIPPPWHETGWWIQQYQGDVVGFPGTSKAVDLNRFNTTKLGDKGAHVRWLRAKLRLDATIELFDEAVAAAVRDYQRNNLLHDDGVVGVRSFASIAWASK